MSIDEHTRRPLWVVLFASVALNLAACGGPIERDELKRGVASMQAVAQEGRLLAQDVAKDRTKSTFVRVHARALSDEADHEAEKLSDAQASGSTAKAKATAVKLAQDIGAALGGLQTTPGDERAAAVTAGRLRALAIQAQQLENQL